MFRLAVLISGSGSNLQAVIDATENGTISNAEVALVISSRADVYGLERAEKHGIVNMVIARNEPDMLAEKLGEHKIDGIVLAGYLSMIPPDVINAYTGRIINIHPALLPLFGGKGFYGIRVHQAVIASGVKFSGATVHLADREYDTGPALMRSVVRVSANETPESLQKKVLEEEHIILVRATKALTENKIDELVGSPMTYIKNEDANDVKVYAAELSELGSALTRAGIESGEG